MNSGALGGEFSWVDDSGNKRLATRTAEDGSGSLIRYTGTHPNEVTGTTIVSWTAAGVVTFPGGSGQGVVTTVNDGTPVITAALSVLEFQKTANTTTAITMTATYPGHIVLLKMLVGDADSVYTAAVTGGAITFNAAEESAIVYFDGTEWRHHTLTGATFA